MQWCSKLPTKIQTSSYAMDHRDWPGKQWLAEHQACRCARLTARLSQTVEPFWRLILSIFRFLNDSSFLFHNSTLLCRHNRIFVDTSYFLKNAVLSPVLSTKHLSTTAQHTCTCKLYLQCLVLMSSGGAFKECSAIFRCLPHYLWCRQLVSGEM